MKERLTRPEKGNKYYIRKAQGGYSPCIKGTPTYADINTLANCVGYATGRFNEIGEYNECKYLGNANAENFTKFCKSQGLELGQTPKLGACMVWEGKGDKAGHVAIVERIYNDNKVLTSESGYGAKKIFWTQTRKKGTGNWGQGKDYVFKGFIYNPAVKEYWVAGKYKLLDKKAIRNNHTLTHNILKVKEIGIANRKNLTSQKPNDDAYYKKGTIINAKSIYTDSTGRKWAELNGAWLVVCNKDGSPQAEKI